MNPGTGAGGRQLQGQQHGGVRAQERERASARRCCAFDPEYTPTVAKGLLLRRGALVQERPVATAEATAVAAAAELVLRPRVHAAALRSLGRSPAVETAEKATW